MQIVIPLANGVEEIEAVTLIDVLRRAGLSVQAPAIGGELRIQGSRGIGLWADGPWSDVDALACEALILPGGGPGTEALRQDRRVVEAVRQRVARNTWVGAICAAPQVLQDAGVLRKVRATCYPACRNGIPDAQWVDAPVVVDGTIITSQGPATAMAFALAFVEALRGPKVRQTVADGLLAGND